MATNLNSQIKKYEKILSASKTAYDPGVNPTRRDINIESELRRLKSQKDYQKNEELKTSWYTDKKGEKKEGEYFKGVLKTLGAPLYSIVGGAEAILGKGTKKGIANIPANVKEEGTFGDLLRNYNTPNIIAAPLGFALDVAFDPLNWAIAGTSALIPRIAVGAIKGSKTGIQGALSGASTGLKSGSLTKLEHAGRLISRISKSSTNTTSKFSNLIKKAEQSREKYDSIVGNSLEKTLIKNYKTPRIGDRVKEFLENKKGGDTLIELFGYSSNKFPEGLNINKYALSKQYFDDLKKLKSSYGVNPADRFVSSIKGEKLSGRNFIIKEIDEGIELLFRGREASGVDSVETLYRLRGEAKNNIEFKNAIDDVLHNLADDGLRELYYSGWERYDKYIEKTINSKIGRGILINYGKFIGIFKSSKIGLNPAAYINALVGNLVMTKMAGIKVANPAFARSMKNATRAVTTNDLESLKPLLENTSLSELAATDPDMFRIAFGINPRLFLNQKNFIDDVTRELKRSGEVVNKSEVESVKNAFDTVFKVRKAEGAAVRSSTSAIDAALSDQGTAMMASEVLLGDSSPYQMLLKSVKASADKGNNFAKAFYAYSTIPIDAYSKVDQGYRLGLALHLTENGISSDELKILSKMIRLDPTGDIIKGAGDIYKLSPKKAMEASLEIYMNYLAMPGFVKIMRSLPVVGFPFISFAYGMTAKTLKTGAYNPALFNKVNFLLQEIAGEKSPLEKEALRSEYYQWYNQSGMVKLPFFKESPIYLNMQNMLPYYTLNVFQPSERSYSNKTSGLITSLMDKSPFLKTPEGQLIFNYFILPTILQEEQPRGMFDQPLWKKDASFAEKLGQVALAGAESVVPPVAGLGGLITPYEIAKYVPSYRFRQIAGAKEGKSALGIDSIEPAAQKTFRTLMSLAGWPTYQLKLQYGKKSKSNK